jgi:3-polyprenyl-4-hydroxybenzoate decarboxylase
VESFLARAGAVLPGVAAPAWGHGRCVFVAAEKRQPLDGAKAITVAWSLLPDDPGVADFMIVVDQGTDLRDWERVLFLMAANADLGRDLHRNGRRVAIDATRKMSGDARDGFGVRRYPPLVGFDAPTVATAERIERASGIMVDPQA